MTRIKHIVVATDLSENSMHAVDRGFRIARHTQARYTIMHALGLDALGPLRNLIGEQAADVSHKLLERQRSALRAIASDAQHSAGVSADIRVEEGLAASVVPAFAAGNDADLLLVGARGEHLLRRLLIGSTASRLLRKSACPVLIARNACRDDYRRILIAVDFSPGSELSIHLARQIAPDADIILLHSFDVPFEGMLQYAGVSQDLIHHYRIEARERALRQLHRMAKDQGLEPGDYSVIVDLGDAAQHIGDQAERSDCDLIVMGKHGTHVTEELLLGSVTRRVLSETAADLLVVVDKRGPTVQEIG
jgi:nucleotide-binding universal stress UspA family protein